MTRFSSISIGALIGTTALPALAQQGSGIGPSNGYPMLWHHSMMFGPVMMLMMFVAVVVLGVVAFRFAGRGVYHPWEAHGHRRMGDAVDILEQRFARGEIDQAEFDTKRTLLSR